MVNFLALLGWNPGNDQEIMSMDELISLFSFEHCSRNGAKFDFEKGKWFNHKYLSEKPDAELAALFRPILDEKGITGFSDEYVARAVGMVKSRISFVKDLWEQASFFFVAPDTFSEKDIKKRWKDDTPRIMEELIGVLENLPDFSSKPSEEIVLKWITDNGYHMGNVMNAFRLVVVGECKGPHMFDITELLGKDETIDRIQKGLEKIPSVNA